MQPMHSYDAESRSRVVAFLAVCSIFLVWLCHTGLSTVEFEPQWWFSVPSFAGMFSGLYWAFDRWVWRFGPLRKVGIVRIPDLNGKWEGQVASLAAEGGGVYAVSIVIRQRWSRIVVTLETQYSRSRSIAASLRTDDVPNPELSYLYINEPKAIAATTMSMHRGTTVMELKDDVLEGDYYTGRGRMTFGAIRLTRAR